MRTAFFEALLDEAERDERIWLMVGDLGFGVVERFQERFPERFVNAGVAEQNMTGMAAGVALTGRVVFTYSIGNFPTLRCLEQIRNDVCYHNADVKIVAVGGGFAYGGLGMSHHTTEDIAILRALPNMTVIAPGDPVEAAAATRAAIALPGPCYLRLGRAGETNVHSSEIEFEVGRAIRLRQGNDLTLISTGGMLVDAVSVAETLEERGITVRVVSMHTVKPLDVAEVISAATETGAIATLEEHSVIGGLGGAVAEALVAADVRKVPFLALGLESKFAPVAGDQEYLKASFGLSRTSIVDRLTTLVRTTSGTGGVR